MIHNQTLVTKEMNVPGKAIAYWILFSFRHPTRLGLTCKDQISAMVLQDFPASQGLAEVVQRPRSYRASYATSM